MRAVFESCRIAPFTRSRMERAWGSGTREAATPREIGANVSKPLHAVHGEPSWRALLWRSRAVTSKNTA
ncbi:MAG: hypothetical protein A3K68_06350 [Euryarchaeota archaeon RBG_16_68_13]|nr:MAG: hypothetical protein A3K68_06350 [Euryarchaeota archaeon RBG_16_68_13]